MPHGIPEKRQLIKDLCKFMGWNEKDAFKIQNGPMAVRYLKQIVEELESKKQRGHA